MLCPVQYSVSIPTVIPNMADLADGRTQTKTVPGKKSGVKRHRRLCDRYQRRAIDEEPVGQESSRLENADELEVCLPGGISLLHLLEGCVASRLDGRLGCLASFVRQTRTRVRETQQVERRLYSVRDMPFFQRVTCLVERHR